MKLEKYVDKNEKKRKVILISISTIVLISISFLLYKTFASFTESAEFPMMKGKVDYFGNSDVYFTFYQGDEQLEEMPQKDNPENLVFDHGECDNGATIEWNSEEWGPIVKNLSKSKTKCSLYFKKQDFVKLGEYSIPLAENGNGLYKIEHNDLTELSSDWKQVEYRYGGSNPNNYIKFNDEKWRIIGLVNVETKSGVEQRIKIVRTNGIEGQNNFGNYSWDYVDYYSIGEDNNDWITSTLKDMLNGIYYNSSSGECYTGTSDADVSSKICDFSNGIELPKGLNQTAQGMVDNGVIWNIGGWDISNGWTLNIIYESERGTITGNDNEYPYEWTSENDSTFHNGVGLMYPSDYLYSIDNNLKNNCIENLLFEWENNCKQNNWLDNNEYKWFLTSSSISNYESFGTDLDFGISTFSVRNPYIVEPVVYLKSSVRIATNPHPELEYGSIYNPFILE